MKPNKLECVIFDLDGTIIDSEKVWRDTSLILNVKYNMTMDDNFRLFCCGRGRAEVVAKIHELWPHVDAPKVRDEWCRLVDEEIENHGVEIKPGFESLYIYLKQQNIKLAITTGSNRETLIKCTKRAKLDVTTMFDYLFTIDDVKKGKPNPEIYKLALKTMHVEPKNCFAIEDSSSGAQAAWLAGINVLLVPDVFKPTQEALDKCIVLNDLNDAREYLQGVINDK